MVVIREGEPGALFYIIIVEGEAVVSVQGRSLRTMGPGEGFGEIALLRDVPGPRRSSPEVGSAP